MQPHVHIILDPLGDIFLEALTEAGLSHLESAVKLQGNKAEKKQKVQTGLQYLFRAQEQMLYSFPDTLFVKVTLNRDDDDLGESFNVRFGKVRQLVSTWASTTRALFKALNKHGKQK